MNPCYPSKLIDKIHSEQTRVKEKHLVSYPQCNAIPKQQVHLLQTLFQSHGASSDLALCTYINCR